MATGLEVTDLARVAVDVVRDVHASGDVDGAGARMVRAHLAGVPAADRLEAVLGVLGAVVLLAAGAGRELDAVAGDERFAAVCEAYLLEAAVTAPW